MALTGIEKGGGGLHAHSIKSGQILARHLAADVRSGAYAFNAFKEQPMLVKADGYTAVSGVDTTENIARFANGLFWHYCQIAAQTILGPVLGASGLDVGQDKAADNGVAIYFGGPPASAFNHFAIAAARSGMARFARLKFKIADVSGTDDCAFGWIKAEAHAAAIDDLTDFFVLNAIAGNVKRESALNAAATVTVDTTKDWADGETHTMEVQVDGSGYASAFWDGADITSLCGARYRFDASDVLIPYFYLLQDTGTEVDFLEFETGTLFQLGKSRM